MEATRWRRRVAAVALAAVATALPVVASPAVGAAAQEMTPAPESVSSLVIVGPNGYHQEFSSAQGDYVWVDTSHGYRVSVQEPGGAYAVHIAPLWGEKLRVGDYPEAGSRATPYPEPDREWLSFTTGSSSLEGYGSFTVHTLPDGSDTSSNLWFTWELETRYGHYYGEARVAVQQPQPELVTVPGIVDWPDQHPGDAAPTVPVTVVAQGTEPVEVTEVAVTAGGSEFAVEATTCGVLQPGESCQVDVTFTPTSPGPRTGLLTIEDTSPAGVHQVPLLGTGVPGDNSWFIDNPPSTGFTGAGTDTLTPDLYDLDGRGSPTFLAFDYEIRSDDPGAKFRTGELLVRAPAGRPFAPGEVYTGLPSYSGDSRGEQQLTIDHILCSSTGSLTVDDIAFSERGHLTRADLGFTQQCSDRQNPLVGRIRWRADQQPSSPPPGDEEAPAAVEDLRVVSTPQHPLTLWWSPSTSPDWVEVIVRGSAGGQAPATPADGYPVYRGRYPFATVDDLAMDGTHSFSVFARDAAGNLNAAASLTSPDVVPPHPLDVDVDASRPVVDVTWAASTAPDIDHVVVTAARWPGGEDAFDQVAAAGLGQLELAGIDGDDFWQVWARPVDEDGNVGEADPVLLEPVRHPDPVTVEPETVSCGDRALLSGKLGTEWSDYGLLDDYLVLEARTDGGAWTEVDRRYTMYGHYQFPVTPCTTTDYRVRFDGNGTALWTTSPTVTIEVPTRLATLDVSLSATDRRVTSGERVRFTSRIDLTEASVPVRLQARTATGWRTLRESTYEDGAVGLAVRPRRTRDYRVVVQAGDTWRRAVSDSTRVRVR